MSPGADILKSEELAAKILSLRCQLQRTIEEDTLGRMYDPAGNRGPFPLQQKPDRQRSSGIVLLQSRLEPQILQMYLRLGIEKHGPEDTAEAEEVLILDPRCAAALVDLHAQPVACLPDIRGQVKLRWRKTVLGIPHKLSVEPHIVRLLHALEADAHALAPQSRAQVKLPHIAAHRIVIPVDLRRTQLRVAVPRVKRVDILDLSVPL